VSDLAQGWCAKRDLTKPLAFIRSCQTCRPSASAAFTDARLHGNFNDATLLQLSVNFGTFSTREHLAIATLQLNVKSCHPPGHFEHDCHM